ncbi:MAG: hypothetical protein ABJC51_03740 [Acidobacteriota bacterium]
MPATPISHVLSALRDTLQIEPEWLVEHPRGFDWWRGTFAQRLWFDAAEPPRLHIETDFLRGLPANDATLERIAYSNRFSTGSALVLSSDGTLRLHASVVVGDELSARTLRIALAAASLQAADASAKGPGLCEFFEATLDPSEHPTSGSRLLGHGILLCLEQVKAENETTVPASELDFTPLETSEPRSWLLAFAGKGGMTAEFPFLGNEPAMLSAVVGTRGPQTALLQVVTDFEHPQFGHGALIRLTLPVAGDAQVAAMLNNLEVTAPTKWADQVGAWCPAKLGMTFVAFVASWMFDLALTMP